MIKCHVTRHMDVWTAYVAGYLDPVFAIHEYAEPVEFPTNLNGYHDFRRIDKNILIQTTYDQGYGTGGIV